MSFINVNLGEDVKERECVPAGPYDLTISSVTNKPSSKGSEMLTIVMDIDGMPDAMPVKHWITLPTAGDDEETMRNKNLGVKRFLTLVGIEFESSGFAEEDLYGATFPGVLTVEMVEEDKDGNPLPKPYEINRLVVPFLQND